MSDTDYDLEFLGYSYYDKEVEALLLFMCYDYCIDGFRTLKIKDRDTILFFRKEFMIRKETEYTSFLKRPLGRPRLLIWRDGENYIYRLETTGEDIALKGMIIE